MNQRAITFPPNGEGEWTNSETGASILRICTDGRIAYEVRSPAVTAQRWEHLSYAHTRLTALVIAKVFIAEVLRPAIAAAYIEACREDAERMAASRDDDLIHHWSGSWDRSACGVDILSTPYTFGAPELALVTCKACLIA